MWRVPSHERAFGVRREPEGVASAGEGACRELEGAWLSLVARNAKEACPFFAGQASNEGNLR